MYQEKMKPILDDIENKDVEIAGGSVVGIVLSTINSLIKYISNLTLGKKKYEDVQDEIQKILEEADRLKQKTLNVIDEDKEVLETILEKYKIRRDSPKDYEDACKNGVKFCMEVVQMAYSTLELSDRISRVGNRMLASDFKICKYYAFASIKSAIVNVEINLNSLTDETYKMAVKEKCNQILQQAQILIDKNL